MTSVHESGKLTAALTVEMLATMKAVKWDTAGAAYLAENLVEMTAEKWADL